MKLKYEVYFIRHLYGFKSIIHSRKYTTLDAATLLILERIYRRANCKKAPVRVVEPRYGAALFRVAICCIESAPNLALGHANLVWLSGSLCGARCGACDKSY